VAALRRLSLGGGNSNKAAKRMPKVKPPYPGQGVPLPNSMEVEGAWIIENIVALTINEPTTPDGEGFFQRAPISPKGNKVFTFDAAILANNFNLSVD
jgi:hypothetical protein